jgi:hypothetical protein
MASVFKSNAVVTVGVTPVTAYTAPAATTSTVIGMSVANTSGVGITVDATLTKDSVVAFLIKGAPIPVGGALVIIGGDQKTVLEAGNLISITSSVAASCDVITSVLELT